MRLGARQHHVALALLLGVIERMTMQKGPDELARYALERELEGGVLVHRVVTGLEGERADAAALPRRDLGRLDHPFRVITLDTGRLHPETYRFRRDTPAHEVLAHMVATFRERWARLDAEHRESVELSRHEVITLASIVAALVTGLRQTPTDQTYFSGLLGMDAFSMFFSVRRFDSAIAQSFFSVINCAGNLPSSYSETARSDRATSALDRSDADLDQRAYFVRSAICSSMNRISSLTNSSPGST